MYFNEQVIPLSALLSSLDSPVAWDKDKNLMLNTFMNVKKTNEIIAVKNN